MNYPTRKTGRIVDLAWLLSEIVYSGKTIREVAKTSKYTLAEVKKAVESEAFERLVAEAHGKRYLMMSTQPMANQSWRLKKLEELYEEAEEEGNLTERRHLLAQAARETEGFDTVKQRNLGIQLNVTSYGSQDKQVEGAGAVHAEAVVVEQEKVVARPEEAEGVDV